MIDPVSMAVGAGILVLGATIGRLSRRGGFRPAVDETRPICGCRHSLAEHDPKTDRCHGRVPRNEAFAPKWMDCRCRRYVGPQPVESLWMPPVLPAEEGR